MNVTELTGLELVRAWIHAENKRKEMQKELDDQKARVATLEEQALLYLTDEDLDGVKLEGKTVFIRTDRFASINKEDEETAFELLEKYGADFLIKTSVNANSLKGWVKEYIEEHGELPEDLKEVLNIFEKPRVRMRKA